MEAESFNPEEFFAEYWRKKPLLIRGGVNSFLGRLWSREEFDAALIKARMAGAPIKERVGEVTFIEGVSRYDSYLGERTSYFARLFGVPSVWFDTIVTHSVSGIGEHFDHSDNFVLNMEGVKRWTVAPPDSIGECQIARRMMNVPGSGAQDLPSEGCLHFTLGPGDILYLPLFWIHSGVSEGASLSVSLVAPALSLYSIVASPIIRLMKKRLMGCDPIPALHSYLSTEARAEEIAEISKRTRCLLSGLNTDSFIQELEAIQRDVVFQERVIEEV